MCRGPTRETVQLPRISSVDRNAVSGTSSPPVRSTSSVSIEGVAEQAARGARSVRNPSANERDFIPLCRQSAYPIETRSVTRFRAIAPRTNRSRRNARRSGRAHGWTSASLVLCCAETGVLPCCHTDRHHSIAQVQTGPCPSLLGDKCRANQQRRKVLRGTSQNRFPRDDHNQQARALPRRRTSAGPDTLFKIRAP